MTQEVSHLEKICNTYNGIETVIIVVSIIHIITSHMVYVCLTALTAITIELRSIVFDSSMRRATISSCVSGNLDITCRSHETRKVSQQHEYGILT